MACESRGKKGNGNGKVASSPKEAWQRRGEDVLLYVDNQNGETGCTRQPFPRVPLDSEPFSVSLLFFKQPVLVYRQLALPSPPLLSPVQVTATQWLPASWQT